MAVRHGKAASALVAAAMCAGLAAGPAAADGEPNFVSFHAGIYDVNDNETAGQFNIEFRSNWDRFYVKPFAGLMATTDASFYGYGGLLLDIYLGRRVVLTPNVAVGLFEKGDGKDLGSVIEFRSGVELAYRFDDRTRLGVAFHHISNASIDDKNPGTETLTLVLSLPLGGVFGGN